MRGSKGISSSRIIRWPGVAPAGQKPASEVTPLRSLSRSTKTWVDASELWVGLHIPQFQNGPELQINQQLERLATRAQHFTPRVSLVPPDGLLLEVKGSLHLFNGVDGLIEALLKECGVVTAEPAVALAPTPLAALAAARVSAVGQQRRRFIVTSKAQLVSRLSALPLTSLRWPEKALERLAWMGVRTVGQVLRLPRAGFARRFGPERLAELDRLTGRDADLRKHFQPRERFRRRRELTYELESHESLLAVLAPLLAALGQFLQQRQCGITELECRLRHRHAPVSICSLRLAAPQSDVARLTELLGERLSALTLPEPVRSCEIRSGLLVLQVLASNTLWHPGEHGGSTGPQSPELIERLRARLGHEAVYGLQMAQSHRPESAWSIREPMVGSPAPRSAAAARPTSAAQSALATAARSASAQSALAPAARPAPTAQHASAIRSAPATQFTPAAPWAAFRRPLWLLPEPQQLEEVAGAPRRRGALRFVGDVERLETGWWDGNDVGRDYYTAFDIYGVQLWIFRERAGMHRWFLHGVFG